MPGRTAAPPPSTTPLRIAASAGRCLTKGANALLGGPGGVGQHYDEDPAFEQGFVFTVVNPHSDDLHVKVIGNVHL